MTSLVTETWLHGLIGWDRMREILNGGRARAIEQTARNYAQARDYALAAFDDDETEPV